MAYIGKDPAQIKRALNEKDTFTGDGSTVAFDLTSDASGANEIQVFVDNIRQEPGASDAYTLGEDGSGNLRRITFTAAPDSGAEIYVINPKTTDSNLIVPSDNSVTSAKIVDGAIVNTDINACAAISDTKLGTISTACKVATSAISQPGSSSVYLAGDGSWGAIDTSQQDTNAFNISLLGFKMAVNEGLTVFNLVDGVVDEFNDESGTDEAEGSNDTYCAISDNYINGATICLSAGFTTSAVTEPDTSTAGTNPDWVCGSYGSFSVPSGVSNINVFTWGAGGGRGNRGTTSQNSGGGGGGFSSGTLAVSACTSFTAVVGEGGKGGPIPGTIGARGRGLGSAGAPNGPSCGSIGGGMTGIFTCTVASTPIDLTGYSAPVAVLIAGGGGSGGYNSQAPSPNSGPTGTGVAGAGGGPQGGRGDTSLYGCGAYGDGGGGGTQTTGGQGGSGGSQTGNPGVLFGGGSPGCSPNDSGTGGGGYYGGGGNGVGTGAGLGYENRQSGGGSGYISHPQISCGVSEAGNLSEGGGVTDPNYVACTNEGHAHNGTAADGEDGYILITASGVSSCATSTTIVSTAFTSTSVPTSARIVVFEENVDTPTLNTDIIASVSRDGGSTFTNATLSDSGYVTGSSGQRILTGQATISGQPSGQSMRWKLALANNQVKIHGVSLQWA